MNGTVKNLKTYGIFATDNKPIMVFETPLRASHMSTENNTKIVNPDENPMNENGINLKKLLIIVVTKNIAENWHL